jgi:hypothetical protein
MKAKVQTREIWMEFSAAQMARDGKSLWLFTQEPVYTSFEGEELHHPTL